MKKKIRNFLAYNLPEPAKVIFYRGWQAVNDARFLMLPVKYRSSICNVFHCTVQKTASQWMKSLLFDQRIYMYSGLKPWNSRVWGIDPRRYQDRRYERPFSKCRIITPLFVNYECFKALPKPEEYAAFFVMRDPRDIVPSHYFSTRFSHTPMGDILERRALLNNLPLEEGLICTIKYLENYGLFDALRSWRNASGKDSRVFVVKYEDLVGPRQYDTIKSIFEFCDVQIPEKMVKDMLNTYSFSRMRLRRGDLEDHEKSHYRSGKPGDWKTYFTDRVESAFRKCTGDLVEFLGYTEN